MSEEKTTLMPDWIPDNGLWVIYLMATTPDTIEGFPEIEAYLYIEPNDTIMSGQQFYDELPTFDGTSKKIGQFTEQNEALLLQIEREYGIVWIGADAAEKG